MAEGNNEQLPFTTELYPIVESNWPISGKHILASFDSDSIIVYQAFNSTIANYATTNNTFLGCPKYSTTRMTWIKTNFLWMMYRCGWCRKDQNQTNVLAIKISRTGFEEILKNATTKENSDVRLQWDPDHDPYGNKILTGRRAIQLGLRNKILEKYLNDWIISITDITKFVEKQREFIDKKELNELIVPKEEIYYISDPDLRNQISLDD